MKKSPYQILAEAHRDGEKPGRQGTSPGRSAFGCTRRHQGEIKEAVQAAFKAKVASVHTSTPRQSAAAGPDVWLPARLEEGIR